MLPNDNAILLFRFTESRWADAIIQGQISFSCAGAFIHQAEHTGNTVQGDLYEGVFARLNKTDSRVQLMKDTLKKDLEIIDDGDFVLLRRKSALRKPMFCYYAYTVEDAIHDCGDDAHKGINTIRHVFDDKMYSGFSENWRCSVIADNRRSTLLTLQPKPFVERIKMASVTQRINLRMKRVDYSTWSNETFFITPTDEYDELFCKQSSYSYQHEGRACLTGISLASIFDRYTLEIGSLNTDDYKKSFEPLYFDLKAKLEVNNV